MRLRLLVSLAPVVMFCACAGVDPEPRPAAAAASLSPAQSQAESQPMVRLRIDDGPVSAPVVHPAAGKATLVVQFPKGYAGRLVDVSVDRAATIEEQRVRWQRFRPTVRGDSTLVLTGLDNGRYWLWVECDDAAVGTAAVAIDGPRRFTVAVALPAAPASGGR